jgi:protoheme ferro-lyase
MTYSYVFIAFMCDHYETLVEQSRSAKELDVRLEAWMYWKTLLIQCQQ